MEQPLPRTGSDRVWRWHDPVHDARCTLLHFPDFIQQPQCDMLYPVSISPTPRVIGDHTGPLTACGLPPFLPSPLFLSLHVYRRFPPSLCHLPNKASHGNNTTLLGTFCSNGSSHANALKPPAKRRQHKVAKNNNEKAPLSHKHVCGLKLKDEQKAPLSVASAGHALREYTILHDVLNLGAATRLLAIKATKTTCYLVCTSALVKAIALAAVDSARYLSVQGSLCPHFTLFLYEVHRKLFSNFFLPQ